MIEIRKQRVGPQSLIMLQVIQICQRFGTSLKGCGVAYWGLDTSYPAY